MFGMKVRTLEVPTPQQTALWATPFGGLSTSNGANGAVTLIMSHDGRGAERPGVTMMDTSSQLVTATHRFDQLPSNGRDISGK